MILHTIEIEQFGGLKDYTLELEQGLCYVYGANEAGKSTLCAFIAAMFYGMPGKQRGAGLKGDSRRLYMPWHEKYMSGSITFSAEGQTYVLKRRFGSTARGDSCTLLSATDWQTIEITPDEIGPRFLGMGADAFHKTLFISQLGAAFTKGREDELLTRLSNLESTGEEDASVQKAMDSLAAAAYELVTKTGRGGAIAQLDSKIEALEAETLAAAKRGEALQSLLAEVQRLQAEKETLEKSIAQTEKQKEAALAFAAYTERRKQREDRQQLKSRLQDAQKEQESAAQRLQESKAKQKLFSGVQSMTQETIVHLAEQETEKQQLLAKETEKQSLSDEIAALQQERETASRQVGKGVNIFMLIVAVLVLCIGVAGGFLVSPVLYALGLVAVFLGAVACMGCSGRKKAKEELQRMDIQIAEKEKSLAAMRQTYTEERLRQLTEDIQAVYRAAEVDTLSALSAKIESAKQLDYELKTVRNEMRQTEETIKRLQQQLDAAPQPAEEAEQSYTGDNAQTLEQRLTEQRHRLMESERLLAQYNARLENSTAGTRSYAVIESELEEAKAHRTELAERYEAIMLAYSALQTCAEDLKNNFAPALNKRLSELLNTMTMGRYCDAKMTDDYALKMKEPNGTDVLEAEYVSAGTFELFYFALRLAVLHTLTDKAPLLVLDDAFLQMDEKRRRAAFETLLSEPAEQILYFSCHRPADYIKTVITLS